MNTLNILLIEDDMIERMKFNKTMKSLDFNHNIIEARNGEDAINALTKSTDYLPDLILLDLNMPKLNGIEFLTFLKSNSTLKFIPVVVLTTSRNKLDIKECYRIGIAGYVLKPLLYDHYVLQIKSVLEYWSRNELIKLNT